jgi:replication factor C small subunit
MNHFEIEEHAEAESQHTIFVEKYRPSKLEDYVGDKVFKATLQSFIDKKDIPHLLFYNSSPGTGKTAAAKILVKNIPCDYLYLNASDENGIETVRTKIKGFASSAGFYPLKIVILDECDQITPEGQGALRNLIETFSLHTRFILTCNYMEKMIPPIVSRCQTHKVESPTKKEVALLVKSILDKESIKYTAEDLAYIVNTYYPDMRKVINFAQQSVVESQLIINRHNIVETDTKLKVLELLKTAISNPTTFNTIRQLIADADIRFYDEYYKFLYDKVGEFAKGKDVLAILTIAEYLYQSSLVVDKEITFMACIARLIKELK